MKHGFNAWFAFFLFALNVGIVEAEKANPPRDFKYDLNREGTGVIIKRYKGSGIDVIIPSMIEDFPVVGLGSEAFSKSSIVSVVIPDSVTILYKEVFKYCKLLQKVSLPKNLEDIPHECFLGCSSLKEITLSEGLKVISDKAFVYSGLESISIPNSVFLIGTKAFDECKNLKTVIIGNGIKTIGEEAFEDCSSLTTFNIGVEKLDFADGFYIGMNWYNAGYGDDVFEGCSSLSLKERKKIRDTGYIGSF